MNQTSIEQISFLDTVLFGNDIKTYLLSITLFLILFFVIKLFKNQLIKKLDILFKKTKNEFDDLIVDILEHISTYFLLFFAFHISTKFLALPEIADNILNKILLILITYEIVVAIKRLINFFVEKISFKKDSSSKLAYKALSKFAIWIVWIMAILFVLSNFDIDVTALATGLGIGGIAIAFAFQSILKDLFSYFTILLDKPIEEGDYIYVGDKKGTVKSIGIKTTRLSAVDGDEVIISNKLITDEKLENFGKTKHRRVKFEIGVSYDTSPAQLKKIKKEIKEIIKSFKENKLERCHFKSFGDSSLNFEAVYNIKTRDYSLYMDINEKVNLKILEYLEKEKIDIPFPTRTVYNK